MCVFNLLETPRSLLGAYRRAVLTPAAVLQVLTSTSCGWLLSFSRSGGCAVVPRGFRVRFPGDR